MAQQVILHMEAKMLSYGDRGVVCVESIKRPDEDVIYMFPEESQPISVHNSLNELPIVQNAKKCLKKCRQYRNLRITFTETLSAEYWVSESEDFRRRISLLFHGQRSWEAPDISHYSRDERASTIAEFRHRNTSQYSRIILCSRSQDSPL